MLYNISNTLSVMLEFPICKRSTDIESASNKLEERKSLITDTTNEKMDSSNESKFAFAITSS